LERLLRPRSIAVVGGGAWCASVLGNCAGFEGPVWWVHPTKGDVARVQDLPEPPDAVFLGVNREASVAAVRVLSAMGAGGAVCFAAGFAEAVAELEDGAALQAELLAAAGAMPILGPNCYGVLNYLDGVGLWPDTHGGVPVTRGVAIVAQSSNIALNITMQARGLPISYVVTLGNQAQMGVSDVVETLAADPRVSAIGLYLEGLDDLARFVEVARAVTVPMVALKVGRSAQSQAGAVSHTAALVGSSAGSAALLRRLGVGEVESLPVLLEALKLLHCAGGLAGNRVVSASCSGGEASLMADLGAGLGVVFPPLQPSQRAGLRAALGPKVALANPLDYNTYIWADREAMTATFTAMTDGAVDLGLLVLDFPRGDRCNLDAWEPAVAALEAAADASAVPMGLVASLPEALPEGIADRLAARGIVPFVGMAEALAAVAVVAGMGALRGPAPLVPGGAAGTVIEVWSEARAKAALAEFGVPVPRDDGPGPFVVKATGMAHKTDRDGVRLGVAAGDVAAVAQALGGAVLVEEMIDGAVAEVLVAVVRDPAHGFVLTLGAGGVDTELWGDTAQLLVPSSGADIRAALESLRIAPKFSGWRGRPGVDMAALVALVQSVQDFITAHADRVWEVEINPVICTPDRAVAVDALIRMAEE
jgi:acyl-CoA synthetase (NDP forming)